MEPFKDDDLDFDNYKLFNKNFFEVLPSIQDKSVDMVFADLPYNCTDCAWDKEVIDLDAMWIELKRIAKSDRTPFIFTCTTQFGYQLIKSNPKMFKMDMVWKKRNKTGGLQSRFRPMRNHEMIYFFYKKAPCYNRDTYHKRIKTEFIKAHKIPDHATEPTESKLKAGKDAFGNNTKDAYTCGKYDPPNPGSTIELKDICPPPMVGPSDKFTTAVPDGFGYTTGAGIQADKKGKARMPNTFEPPNPGSIIDANVNEKGKSAHGYDIEYMNAPRVPAFDPKLPVSVQEYDETSGKDEFGNDVEMKMDIKMKRKTKKDKGVKGIGTTYSTSVDGSSHASDSAWKGQPLSMTDTKIGPNWDPKLPTSVLDVASCCHGSSDPLCERCAESNSKLDDWGYGGLNIDIKTRITNIGAGTNNHFDPKLPVSCFGDMSEDAIDACYMCTCGIEPELPQTTFESKKVFIGKRNHQTEKPVDLMEFLVKYWSNENDVVLDHTMGSGSMGVACAKLNRKFIGCELNEKIFNIAVKRIKAKK